MVGQRPLLRLADGFDREKREGGQLVRIDIEFIGVELRANGPGVVLIVGDHLAQQVAQECAQIHPFQIRTLVEGAIDQCEGGDPLAGVGHGGARAGVGQGPLLHADQ